MTAGGMNTATTVAKNAMRIARARTARTSTFGRIPGGSAGTTATATDRMSKTRVNAKTTGTAPSGTTVGMIAQNMSKQMITHRTLPRATLHHGKLAVIVSAGRRIRLVIEAIMEIAAVIATQTPNLPICTNETAAALVVLTMLAAPMQTEGVTGAMASPIAAMLIL